MTKIVFAVISRGKFVLPVGDPGIMRQAIIFECNIIWNGVAAAMNMFIFIAMLLYSYICIWPHHHYQHKRYSNLKSDAAIFFCVCSMLLKKMNKFNNGLQVAQSFVWLQDRFYYSVLRDHPVVRTHNFSRITHN